MKPVAWGVLALLLTSIPATAQDEGGPLLEDDRGDVVVEAGAQSAASPTGSDRVDILALDVTERFDALVATVQLASMEEDAHLSHSLVVDFDYAGRGHRLIAFSYPTTSDYHGYLAVRDEGTGRHSYQDGIAVETDAAAGTVRFTVPRDLVFGADGAPLAPGRSLEAIHVRSEADRIGSVSVGGDTVRGVSFSDEAGDAVLPVLFGVEQTGHARLHSDAPFRSSNGAATTFVYRVLARNLADQADAFSLAVQDVPAGWDVTFPERVRLEAGGDQTVPVVVRTPFVHQHGAVESFLVALTSDTDAGSVGRVELGIRYPEIPQPAGHHDTLWLHSFAGPDDPLGTAFSALVEALVGRGEYDAAVMNAVEDDGRTQGVPVEGYACETNPNGTSPLAPTYCWDVFLNPGLDMGLDFDLARAGSMEASFHALVPTSGARLAGQLVWFGPPQEEESEFGFTVTTRETLVLADVVGGGARDIGADGEALLEATVVPRPEADLVRYQHGAGLWLMLRLETDRVDHAYLGPHLEPELLPGGTLRLPLDEYADPVEDVFEGADSVRLDAVTEQERLLNPGDTAVFTVDVVHVGAGRDTYTARVVGGNVGWATLIGPTTFTLGDNGTQRLSVSVLAPADAADGDAADLVLEVASNSDLAARDLVRLVATVDTDGEHPDDAAQARALARGAGRESPGPGALLPVLAAAAAALAARRRT